MKTATISRNDLKVRYLEKNSFIPLNANPAVETKADLLPLIKLLSAIYFDVIGEAEALPDCVNI